jgi:hypothetical protein
LLSLFFTGCKKEEKDMAKEKEINLSVNQKFCQRLPYLPLFLLICIFSPGCFGTKTITVNDKTVAKKENILLYQNDNVYEVFKFNFNDKYLTGELWSTTLPNLPKSKKMKYLEIYIEPGYRLEFEDDNHVVSIPYSAFDKMTKTRFRAEYGLLIIPAWLIGGITIYYLGALIQIQH